MYLIHELGVRAGYGPIISGGFGALGQGEMEHPGRDYNPVRR